MFNVQPGMKMEIWGKCPKLKRNPPKRKWEFEHQKKENLNTTLPVFKISVPWQGEEIKEGSPRSQRGRGAAGEGRN